MRTRFRESKFFSEKRSEEYLNFLSVQKITVDGINDDYKIVFYCYPRGDAKRFVFFGIPKGEFLSRSMFESDDLNEVLQFIKNTYPKMDSVKWEKYKKLLKDAKDATTFRCISNNEKTRNDEDVAVAKLVKFQKLNGLV